MPPDLEPYAVTTEPLWRRLDRSPLGVSIPPANWFDPTHAAVEPFFDRLDDHDARVFAPLGMRMPRWALYDCAALPGIIFGLGTPSATGLLPVSMCLLTPRLGPDEWLAYSISSLPSDPEIEVETLALAAIAVRARRLVATTQWSSQRLDVHIRFAPLTLLASWIPAHTSSTSFTYAIDVTPERLERARHNHATDLRTGDWIDPDNISRLHVLQARIETGVRIDVLDAELRDGKWRVLVGEAST